MQSVWHGLYEFESDDADSGEFTYFFLAPDTSAETYHIEFRYGSDAEALSQYDAGEYAYWVASGISTDCDQTIARAMLKNAPILILDEATAFADPDNEAKVQAAFAQLAKGKTVLMIAHRLSTVANADCIYVVQDGQIVESGTKDELCAQNGLFARMWQEYQASVQWKVAKEG